MKRHIIFSVLSVRHSVHMGKAGPCTGPQAVPYVQGQAPAPSLYRVSVSAPFVQGPRPPLRTCSNLFNLDLTVLYCTFKLVHYEAWIVRKRTFNKKCLLVKIPVYHKFTISLNAVNIDLINQLYPSKHFW